MLFIYFIELKLSSKSAKIIFEIPIAIYVWLICPKATKLAVVRATLFQQILQRLCSNKMQRCNTCIIIQTPPFLKRYTPHFVKVCQVDFERNYRHLLTFKNQCLFRYCKLLLRRLSAGVTLQ